MKTPEGGGKKGAKEERTNAGVDGRSSKALWLIVTPTAGMEGKNYFGRGREGTGDEVVCQLFPIRMLEGWERNKSLGEREIGCYKARLL